MVYVCVTVPRVKRLVRVEAVAVPAVDASGAGLGAVYYGKVPVPFNLKRLDEIGFAYTAGIDVLDFDKLQRRLFPSA